MVDVINNGYCLGCGGCQVLNKIPTKETEYGEFLPQITSGLDDSVCPVSNALDELDISTELYDSHGLEFDDHIGYFKSLCAGYVTTGDYRSGGTSGGMTKWFLFGQS